MTSQHSVVPKAKVSIVSAFIQYWIERAVYILSVFIKSDFIAKRRHQAYLKDLGVFFSLSYNHEAGGTALAVLCALGVVPPVQHPASGRRKAVTGPEPWTAA